MGLLLDILTSETFRKRPAMYVGCEEFDKVSFWIAGVEFCWKEAFPDQPYELDGFREWLHMNFDGPGNMPWMFVIESVFGTDGKATEKAFECLDAFLKDLNEIGLDQIIADHAEYEKKRYGLLASSRLRKTSCNYLLSNVAEGDQ